jgi:hypothetical protein
MIFGAHELGFSPEAEFRDRTQMQFVALLVRQEASRLILKGGMAMRALYGSTRLTKDVDFDCEDSDPTELWVRHIPPGVLGRKRAAIMAKIDCIDFALAAAELLPYIAPDIRQSINESRWDEIRLDVAHHLEGWMDAAIARAKPSSDDDHDPSTDIDFAGR